MLLRYILSIIVFSLLTSAYANAQASFSYELQGFNGIDGIEALAPIDIRSYINGSTAEMHDQLNNKGCMPRGELIPDARGGFGFYPERGSINEKNSVIRLRFTVCDDNLVSLTEARAKARISMSFRQYNKETISKKSIPKVTLLSPSGQKIALTSGCLTIQTVKSCFFVSRPSNSQEDQHNDTLPLFEAGTYSLTIENPGISNFYQNIEMVGFTNKLSY